MLRLLLYATVHPERDLPHADRVSFTATLDSAWKQFMDLSWSGQEGAVDKECQESDECEESEGNEIIAFFASLASLASYLNVILSS